jgi:hypothetical protein
MNVDKAEQLLKEDRRLLLRELSDSLNAIGNGSSHHYSGIRHESSVCQVGSSWPQ